MFGKKKIKEIEKHLEKFKICHHCNGLFLASSMKKVTNYYNENMEETPLYFCNQHTPNYDEVKGFWDCDADEFKVIYSKKKTNEQIEKPNYEF